MDEGASVLIDSRFVFVQYFSGIVGVWVVLDSCELFVAIDYTLSDTAMSIQELCHLLI